MDGKLARILCHQDPEMWSGHLVIGEALQKKKKKKKDSRVFTGLSRVTGDLLKSWHGLVN